MPAPRSTKPEFTKPPRFNHVAMSVPADLLDDEHRKLICEFYGDVFGWDELHMTAPRLDHFGMGVSSVDELDELLARAKAFAERDDRVDIIDKHADVHPGVTITSFYVRYLLPLMVEVQHFGWG